MPPMPFHDLLTDRQPNSCPRILRARVQTLENHKDLLSILGIDPDPVILDAEHPLVAPAFCLDLNPWYPIVPEFDGITDEILKQLYQLRVITQHDRQGITHDLRARLLNRLLEIAQRAIQRRLARGRYQRFPRVRTRE